MVFRVGQKVGYVSNGTTYTGTQLSEKEVYVIHSFCNKQHAKGETGIHLVGIINSREPGVRCECYNIRRFRPIIEGKTDTGIAILRKLLTDTKIKERA